MEVILEVSERTAALGDALGQVSKTLDALLETGSLTTDFMVADRSAGTMKYVPAYVFNFVRDAGTCERFEDLSRDHTAFFDRMISHVKRWVDSSETSPLDEARSCLLRFPKASQEHAKETRALHMARMLDMGWALLVETAGAGHWEIDPRLEASVADALSKSAPPLPYRTRDGIVRHAVAVLSCRGLIREASAAETFLRYNPIIHG